ncbi:MAG: thiamine pyrophosphate-binding protein [Candidatus Freyarchaeota archaeon]
MPYLTGGEIIAKTLLAEKIPYAVGIPGHGNLGLVDAFKEHEVPIIQVRHEQSACHLADGYCRVTGKPLAVFTSIGPGACNTVIGAATAYLDSIPMLIFTGSVHTYMFGRGVLQEIERKHWADFPRVMEPVVKKSYQVTRVDQLPWVLNNALRTALGGRPGPVHIDLPMDVQAEAAEVSLPEPVGSKLGGRVQGDPEKILEAAKLLAKAERPAILAGGGVILSNAEKELLELTEFLGAPVITTMMGKGVIPEDHPLSAFYTGSKGSPVGRVIGREADVLLAVGCRFADETTSSYKPGESFSIPPTKLIHVDIDPGEIGKNYPVEVPILGDAKSVLGELLKVLKKITSKKKYEQSDYFKKLCKLKEDWEKELQQLREGYPTTISRYLKELRKVLPRETIVVTSAGHAQASGFQEFPVYYPRTHISPGGFSTMGFGVPAAIGAKLAKPETPVIAMEGDGSFLMTCQELATAVQYEVPILITIFNNYGWIAIRDLQIDVYGKERSYGVEFRNRAGQLYSPDYVKLAESFGCYAEKIDRGEQVAVAIKNAMDSGKPAVIELEVALEHPRSQGKAYGWWDVPIPKYLKK